MRSVPPPPAGPKSPGRIRKALSSAWTGTRILVAVVLVSIGASACRVGETYRAPETKVSERWTEDAIVGGGTVESAWWKAFGDATLDGLVQRALAGNFDLKIGAGLGLRWRSPVGLVRVDLGTPIGDDYASGVELHVIIGPDL